MADTVNITVGPPESRYRSGIRQTDDPTPDDGRRARREARNGRPARLYAILEYFRQFDDEIPGALQSLISAITDETLTVETAEETDEAARQKAFAEAVFDDLDLVALLADLLLGHYFGLRAVNPAWDGYGHEGQTYHAPVTYETVPMSWLYAQKERRTDEYTTPYVGDRPYHTYPPGSLLLYVAGKLPSWRDVDFNAFGCGQAAVRYGVFAWYGWEDWAAFAEAWGQPAIVGTLLQGWGKRDKELLLQLVKNLQSDLRGIKTEKGKIDLIDSPFKASGTGLFDKLIDAAARARARIIKSESLTDNMNRHGSNAAMMTTNGIRLDVAGGLARRLTRLLRRRLLYPMLDLNFKRRLITVSIKVQAVEDLLRELKIDQGLQKMGVDLSVSEVRSRYGRSRPETDEDTLGASAGTFDPFGGI